jgi:hypothetical protein
MHVPYAIVLLFFKYFNNCYKFFVIDSVTIRYTVKPTGQKIRPIITIVAFTVTEPAIYKGLACYAALGRNKRSNNRLVYYIWCPHHRFYYSIDLVKGKCYCSASAVHKQNYLVLLYFQRLLGCQFFHHNLLHI